MRMCTLNPDVVAALCLCKLVIVEHKYALLVVFYETPVCVGRLHHRRVGNF